MFYSPTTGIRILPLWSRLRLWPVVKTLTSGQDFDFDQWSRLTSGRDFDQWSRLRLWPVVKTLTLTSGQDWPVVETLTSGPYWDMNESWVSSVSVCSVVCCWIDRKAKELIGRIMSKGHDLPADIQSDGHATLEMMIPGNKAGIVIGKGGETIKLLQVWHLFVTANREHIVPMLTELC